MSGVRFVGSAALVAALLAFGPQVLPPSASASHQKTAPAAQALSARPSPSAGPGTEWSLPTVGDSTTEPTAPASHSAGHSASPSAAAASGTSRVTPSSSRASAPQATPASPAAAGGVEPAAPAAPTAPTAAPGAPPAPAPPAPVPPGSAGVIHLTFDDGPDPTWTPQVLALLKEHGARATFFEIGRQAAAHPDLLAAVRAGGHAIGNHSWSHPDLSRLSPGAVSQQLTDTTRALGGAACMRPPYGAVGGPVRGTAAALGLSVTLWDIDTRDWERPGADVIAQRVLGQARNGAVVLLHDGGNDRSQTLAATRAILTTLGAAGWSFEPIPGC